MKVKIEIELTSFSMYVSPETMQAHLEKIADDIVNSAQYVAADTDATTIYIDDRIEKAHLSLSHKVTTT